MPGHKANYKQILLRLQPLIALLLMVVVFSYLSPEFRTADNWRRILLHNSVTFCLSIGMTLVILTGGIDLSVGSILALVGAVVAGLLKHGIQIQQTNHLIQFAVPGAVLCGLLVGLSLGLFNGLMITRFRIPPFVATLGMMSIARGLTKLWTKGEPITGLGSTFAVIGKGVYLWIPMPVWICAALAGVFVLVTRKTSLGRHVYAVGGNEQAARLCGLSTNRIKVTVYALCGALAAVAGLIQTSWLNCAEPIAGFGYELDSIAAVVIGGTSLSGGRGSILGTLLGCLIIGVLTSGLIQLGVQQPWQDVIKGLVILVAVAIDKITARGD